MDEMPDADIAMLRDQARRNSEAVFAMRPASGRKNMRRTKLKTPRTKILFEGLVLAVKMMTA